MAAERSGSARLDSRLEIAPDRRPLEVDRQGQTADGAVGHDDGRHGIGTAKAAAATIPLAIATETLARVPSR